MSLSRWKMNETHPSLQPFIPFTSVLWKVSSSPVSLHPSSDWQLLLLIRLANHIVMTSVTCLKAGEWTRCSHVRDPLGVFGYAWLAYVVKLIQTSWSEPDRQHQSSLMWTDTLKKTKDSRQTISILYLLGLFRSRQVGRLSLISVYCLCFDVLWNRFFRSCVGPQNKIGHTAGCRFPCWVPAEYICRQTKTWLVVSWLVNWITWK